MDGSFSLAQRWLRRIGSEGLHLLVVFLLLVPALYAFFCILSFGQDHSIRAFLAFCAGLGRDADGRPILPELGRGLRISCVLIGGSLVVSIPISVLVGWWGSVNVKASGLKVLLTVVSSVPAVALGYMFYLWSKSLVFPVLTLALSDLVLSVMSSHVMKEMSAELRRSYVRTAIAKGVAPVRHYWRRLVVEVICVTKSRIAYLIGGTVVIERVFSLRGLGNMAVLAVKRSPPDVTVILWICLISVLSVYILNLCETLLRDALIPSPLTDEAPLRLRDRLAGAWRFWTSSFRSLIAGLGSLAKLRPQSAIRNPQSKIPNAVPWRPFRTSALRVRLAALWRFSAINRAKIVLGVFLWLAALAAFLCVVAAGLLSATGILGATSTGQDALGATLLAGRRLILPVLIGVVIPIVLGVVFGSYAGYFPRSLVGRMVGYFMDVLEAMPKLVLVMTFAVVVRADALYLYKVIPFMGLTFTPLIYDHVRKRVEYLQRMNFVETERALGASTFRIVFLHILYNNCRSIISVHGVHLLGQIVLLDAAFDYLGLAQPEHYTWGALFYNAFSDWLMGGETNLWAFLAPLLAILMSVLSLITLSEGLDAVLEPPVQEAA